MLSPLPGVVIVYRGPDSFLQDPALGLILLVQALAPVAEGPGRPPHPLCASGPFYKVRMLEAQPCVPGVWPWPCGRVVPQTISSHLVEAPA
jgi:hypothetical protein